MLKIYTGKIGSDSGLDITVKSGRATRAGEFFAPLWEMVNAYKAGQMTAEEYTTLYYQLLRDRYRDYVADIVQLAARNEEVTLLCYCKKGQFCHRHLAADILAKICTAHSIPCEIAGER